MKSAEHNQNLWKYVHIIVDDGNKGFLRHSRKIKLTQKIILYEDIFWGNHDWKIIRLMLHTTKVEKTHTTAHAHTLWKSILFSFCCPRIQPTLDLYFVSTTKEKLIFPPQNPGKMWTCHFPFPFTHLSFRLLAISDGITRAQECYNVFILPLSGENVRCSTRKEKNASGLIHLFLLLYYLFLFHILFIHKKLYDVLHLFSEKKITRSHTIHNFPMILWSTRNKK